MFVVTDTPPPEAIEAIGNGLAAFNAADVGPSERRPLAVLVGGLEAQGARGGLNGYTGWGWLFVQWLWLPEDLRGQGLAGKLLQAAEDEARNRGCHSAWIDTFNPQALRAYERQGYAAFGELPDFPVGRTRVFLKKSLVAR
ncbi:MULTISPECIES: GNAT family N-acetyltransferase [unclassified Ensifer]|uniref:GNAT family N-acetyltransferase n=1 Tax=unclassified Ensifer TaxID=2633371 RepID=UPI00071520EB|nr:MULTISPECIES: GNAT family N-acetyltransferase [unclassified Ensifer]KQX55059.1 acetyltransferase [Ensifer sp. Root1298]KQX90089.1 acetyltransferase [Ensifer sp. Root1312]KRC25227.1 acetyltransferase [Ensifer sp. Root74]KRD67147.1 acetyltransferase [Ensifer sp. Root954]